jgi:hypothetical protein
MYPALPLRQWRHTTLKCFEGAAEHVVVMGYDKFDPSNNLGLVWCTNYFDNGKGRR